MVVQLYYFPLFLLHLEPASYYKLQGSGLFQILESHYFFQLKVVSQQDHGVDLLFDKSDLKDFPFGFFIFSESSDFGYYSREEKRSYKRKSRREFSLLYVGLIIFKEDFGLSNRLNDRLKYLSNTSKPQKNLQVSIAYMITFFQLPILTITFFRADH